MRGDFLPGCSDLDIFIVTSRPLLDTHRLSQLISMCTELSGLEVRGIDIAWCSLDEILSHKCNYKFLTIYRNDFEQNHIIIHGKPAHTLQPPYWTPQARCRRLAKLARKTSMRSIVAGEVVKLMLALQGYRGPWDKHSVLSMAREKLDRCSYEVWASYIRCGEPPSDCATSVIKKLGQLC